MPDRTHPGDETHIRQLIARARQKADQEADVDEMEKTVSCVRCPHCHAGVELEILDNFQQVACPFCSESFRIVERLDRSMPVRIGKYELVDKIGMGGYGTVWRARDTELERDVAVKIFHRQTEPIIIEEALSRGPEILEAKIAAKLQHPNIVSVLEFGRAPDTGILYIVSELIEGQSLAERLRESPLGPREAVKICHTVALALHHAHSHDVVHRDLKPGNVLIDQQGKPHLTDFGLAKQVSDDVTVTMDGRVVGTLSYMSPEQARGDSNKADHHCDIYSLGVVLFELLTHERPFRGDVAILLHKVIHDDPPSPRRLNSRVPRDLETICLKCLEKEPRKRYASMTEVAAELQRWLDGVPIQARPITQPERAWRWCQRNPAIALLSSVAILLLLVTVVVASWTAANLKNNLEEQAMNNGKIMAQGMARTILFRLEEMSTSVLDAANDDRVQDLLKRMQQAQDKDVYAQHQESLNSYAAALFEEYNNDMNESTGLQYRSLFVLNQDGVLVAIAGDEDQKHADGIMDKLFVGRDYFQGACAHKGRVDREAIHISHEFHSKYDKLYKFAIAAPIVDSDGTFLGVVETSVPTDSTHALFSTQEAENMLLVVRRDTNERDTLPAKRSNEQAAKFAVFFHPQYKPDDAPQPFLNPLARAFANNSNKGEPELPPTTPLSPQQRAVVNELERGASLSKAAERAEVPELTVDQWLREDIRFKLAQYPEEQRGKIPRFMDPVSKQQCIGGWARVGNTSLIVIIQHRYDEIIEGHVALAQIVVIWGWVALGCVVLIAGTIAWYRA